LMQIEHCREKTIIRSAGEESLEHRTRRNDCMLVTALGIEWSGRWRCPVVMTSIPIDINSGKTLARKAVVSAEGIEPSTY